MFATNGASGIHGYPKRPWDGVAGDGPGAGYCTHSSILFPMWHRPYLLLFEQILWTHVQEIAAQYPAASIQEYQKAAITFRIPYWDWSLNSTLPDVAIAEELTVNTPQGKQTLANPLKAYHFDPYVASDFSTDLPPYKHTVRAPDAAGKSKTDAVQADLKKYQDYLHRNVFDLLSSVTDYQNFSNAAAPNGSISIENIHGAIHNLVGGTAPNLTGHMTLFPYSAFDPVFMLHHCNVDRLIAMWQALYPDSYTVPQASGGDTYMNKAGVTQDVNTPLHPFHADDNGTFHTSASVRYLKPLGYAYPDLIDWTGKNASDFAARTRRVVNTLYHPEWHNPPIAGLNSVSDTKSRWPASDGSNATTANATALSNGTAPLHMGVARTKDAGPAAAAARQWSLRVHLAGPLPHPTTFALSAPDGRPLASVILDPRPDSPFAVPPRLIPLTAALAAAGPRHVEADDVRAFLKDARWEGAGIGPAAPGAGANKATALTATVSLGLVARSVAPATRADAFPTYGEWRDYGKMGLTADGHLAPR